MKNIKHCEQNIKVEITKKMQSSAHKRFLQNFGGNSEKALKKNTQEFCLHSYGVRGCAYHKNIQYCACHLVT